MRENPVILHQGVYKSTISVAQAVFMIVGITIGAGILGLPFVVAQVGVRLGVAIIILLGLVMMSLHLMIGEIAVRTSERLQLPGLAGKYLGAWAMRVMTFLSTFSGIGVLLAYLIGAGQTISSLFGVDFFWSAVIFWLLGAFMIWRGLHTIKKIESVFSFCVIAIIAGLSIYLLPHHAPSNWIFTEWSNICAPLGVVLFALSAMSGVIEAHALLPGSQVRYRRAVVLGTLIPMILYVLFVVAVVGVSGMATTPVATVGLGQRFGGWVLLAGNIFALLAISNAFMGTGVALKQSLMWDHKLPRLVSVAIVAGVPLLLFVAGLHNFVAILNIVGGLFLGTEAIFVVLIGYFARRRGDLSAARYGLHYFWLMAVPIVAVFSTVAVMSVFNIFQ